MIAEQLFSNRRFVFHLARVLDEQKLPGDEARQCKCVLHCLMKLMDDDHMFRGTIHGNDCRAYTQSATETNQERN